MSKLILKINGGIILGNMDYILYAEQNDAESLINQINSCKGFPTEDGLTITWMTTPKEICEFNFETGSKISIGYGVIIDNEVYGCLTQTQKDEIISLSGNIQLCSYIPVIVSGTTYNP